MHIAHVASEMAPLAKVGGLGDVVGSLPAAQQALGDRVTCVLPAYRRVLDRLDLRSAPLVETRYRIAGEEIAGGVIETTHGGVRLLLIRHDDYFDRDGIYDDGRHAWPDNPRRFAWLAGAALTALRRLEPAPEAIFAHDWPLALLPVLLRAHSYPGDPLRHCATIQVIHNMAHQGVFPLDLGRALDLPEHWLDADLLEALGSLNMLKGGILCATKVLTVSPTYAEEIVWPAHGEGLDGALLSRGDDLWGILNGIDTSVWNPRTDPHLPASYDAGNPAGKTRCKRALQEELGLGPRDEAPLFGVVSRIDPQKGIDLIEQAAPWLVDQGAQLVLLGSGRPGLLDPLHGLARIWRESVSIHERFDEALAHRIYAGADFFLMPSRFEPCGLGQMVALRYGTPPIARRTGGLADTVRDTSEHPDGGNGFLFDTPDAEGLIWACRRAIDLYRQQPAELMALRRRGMIEDLSWEHSAQTYRRLLRRAVRRERRRVMENA
ncbi:MAG: glycogen synthase GlgA [Acidobacteriota bacterium]|nr:glycogen synthase GlgA [Acidobacteriota bacterium]